MLDVHKLRVLREAAAQGSFSGAAQQLFFSPSAVSQHIAALEEQTGTRLVIRGARGVRLTDAGALLVRHADAILRRCSRCAPAGCAWRRSRASARRSCPRRSPRSGRRTRAAR
jgi:DNA-binding transcriptional LysR family regulator